MFSGDIKEAEALLTKAYEAARQAGNYIGASSSLGGLLIITWQRGELRRSAKVAQHGIDRFEPSPATITPHCYLGLVLYEWNDLEAAVNHILRAIELGQSIGTMQARVYVHDILACIELARGDNDGFRKAVENADFEAYGVDDRTTVKAEHAAFHIVIALRKDDLITAEKWNSELAGYAGSLPQQFGYVPLYLLIAKGKRHEAREKLRELYNAADRSGAGYLMIACRVCQALAAEAEEEAVEFLSDALTMAEPEGYIRTFVDEGKLLKPLLEKALSKGITPEYTRKLITIIEAEERQKLKKKKKRALLLRIMLSSANVNWKYYSLWRRVFPTRR